VVGRARRSNDAIRCERHKGNLGRCYDECMGERPRSWERAREKPTSVPPVSTEHASAVVCPPGPSRAPGVAAEVGETASPSPDDMSPHGSKDLAGRCGPSTPSCARTKDDRKPHGSGIWVRWECGIGDVEPWRAGAYGQGMAGTR
jgi:hypothetical protein